MSWFPKSTASTIYPLQTTNVLAEGCIDISETLLGRSSNIEKDLLSEVGWVGTICFVQGRATPTRMQRAPSIAIEKNQENEIKTGNR